MSTKFTRGAPPTRAIRRSRQLCRQVHEELELALAELRDTALEGATVFAVELEGGGITLRIGVVAPGDRDPTLVRAALERRRGELRDGIAEAIHRKRTPQLVFVVIPAHIVAGAEAAPFVGDLPGRAVDLHGLDRDGMVACNPRDREAAHRAEVEGIATDDLAAVTCPRCITALFRERRASSLAERRRMRR
jgi:ribosome-binding factor A